MAGPAITVDDAVVQRMLGDERFLSEFPFLKMLGGFDDQQAAGNGRRCGKCGRKNRETATRYQHVKRGLADMDGAKKLKLKQLLGAGEVRIVYRDAKERIVNLRF